jgi:Glucose / Sorbosone dehydrogenase
VDPTKVRTEFWAVGLRNAWRFSFDSATGLLWLGDVGQDRIEEVDLIKRGGNYGWNYREADQPFFLLPQRGRGARGAATTPPPPAPVGPPKPVRLPPDGIKFEEPVFSYFHPAPVAPSDDPNTGNSITGGLVYRGKAQPALAGRYLFADYVSGWIWALSPVDGKGGKATVEKIARRSGVVSFGLDPLTGDVLMAKIDTGYIEKLVPAPATK